MINYEVAAIAAVVFFALGRLTAPLGRLTAPGACVCSFCRGQRQDRVKTYPERYASSTFREVGAE